MNWALLETGFQPGEINMNVDSFLARYLNEHESNPILRLYGWNPPAVSIGYNQDSAEFNLPALQSAGVDLVRRPTGGRAILHWDELTYSIVMRFERKTLHEIYHTINLALLQGVRLLGIAAELVDVGQSSQQLYHQPVSTACFSSSAKSEIQVHGRKLVGSAQRRLSNVVLQHGSLLLGSQHTQISRMLAGISEESAHRTEQHLKDHAIDAETALGRNVTFEEAALSIKQGFEQALDIVFVDPSIDLLEALPLLTTLTT